MLRRALILGCGYTGRRVAALLLERGWSLAATTRSLGRLADLAGRGVQVLRYDACEASRIAPSAAGSRVLLSLPTLRRDGALFEPVPTALAALQGRPAHLTYLSTTGVYGVAQVVNSQTPAAPRTERQRLRVAAERAVLEHPSPALVLRPAAIYGPGRGVHASLRAGRFRLARGPARLVSRIHVDDLAAIIARAMELGLEGTYPVADLEPAPSSDVAAFCAHRLGLALPDAVDPEALSETRRADRRVDGSAVLRRLDLQLRYPTYRRGIPASLAAEAAR